MKFHPDTKFASIETPLGPMLAAASPEGLSGLWFDSQKHHPFAQMPALSSINKHSVLQKAEQWLVAYFARSGVAASALGLSFDLSAGTPFQRAVWRSLLDIAPGALQSYGQVAQAIGKPSASRAVGAAVGKNPISLIVPCHRVVGASGALTGYAGGIDRKVWLLRHEGALL